MLIFSVAFFFRYAPKFDEHARQLLSSGPYPVFVPPDGSVYDYSLDFIKGALVKWDERPGAQFKTLPSSYTVVSEVKYKKPSWEVKTLSFQRCALRKFYVTDSQNTPNQITRGRWSKRA